MEKFEDIRESVEHLREVSKQETLSNPNDHYGLDRGDAWYYFEKKPEWREKIKGYFHELHDAGEKVVYADVCGRATGATLGADESYCFSFKTPDYREDFTEIRHKMDGFPKHKSKFIDGDIFNTRDFSVFLDEIKKGNVSPALVTFEPVAGLQSYTPYGEDDSVYNKVVYEMLVKRFREIVEIVRPGGYIYLSKPFEINGVEDFLRRKPQKEYELSLQMKELSRQLKLKIEIEPGFKGPVFLLRKTEKKPKNKK